MAGPACLIPRESVRLYELCQRGNWDEAMDLRRKLWRTIEMFAQFNLAACIKAGHQLKGYKVGDPIQPTVSLNEKQRKLVNQDLKGLN